MSRTHHVFSVVASAVQQGICGFALRRVALGWLLSAAVHTLLVVVLAVVTLDSGGSSPALVITSSYSQPEPVSELAAAVHVETAERDLEPLLQSVGEPPATLPEPRAIDLVLLDLTPDGFSAAEIVRGPAGAGATVPDGGGALRGDGPPGAQFFGVQAGGNDFVFVVDSSVSMRLKFADALRELEYSLLSLTPSQRFYVIFFDHDAERMTLGKWNRRHTQYVLKTRPEPDLVPATSDNIEGCVQWMHRVQLEPWTNPHKAIAFTLRKLRPDAIFLLSDGEFTDNGLTEQFLKDENIMDDPVAGPRPKVIVHCIAFFSRAGEVTLQRIADTYGGTYRFVGPSAG
jgi:hypothetical protein